MRKWRRRKIRADTAFFGLYTSVFVLPPCSSELILTAIRNKWRTKSVYFGVFFPAIWTGLNAHVPTSNRIVKLHQNVLFYTLVLFRFAFMTTMMIIIKQRNCWNGNQLESFIHFRLYIAFDAHIWFFCCKHICLLFSADGIKRIPNIVHMANQINWKKKKISNNNIILIDVMLML